MSEAPETEQMKATLVHSSDHLLKPFWFVLYVWLTDVVSYVYEAGLPVTEYLNGIPMVTGITYQPSGALSSYTTGVNTGKNVTTSITQDTPLARPSRIQAMLQPSTVLFDTNTYTYDGAGNILQMGGDAFTYDNRSRLVNASYAAMGTQEFTYDRYGNLTSKAGISYGINLNTNRLTSAGYDPRGNLSTNGSETYGYDGLDRQTTHIGGGSTWKYLYDGRDERLAKIPPVGDWTHTFRDDANRVVTEYAGSTHSRDNVFLGNLAVASYANNSVAGNNPVWTFYSSDHLGTPRLITRLTGNDAESRKSWPYGEDATPPSPFQRLRFALMERDTEASRYYDHARNHDFGIGRFISPDQLQGKSTDPQSWNRYTYARSNPLRFNDPNGLETNPVYGGSGIKPEHIRANAGNPRVGQFGPTRDGGRTFHRGVDILAPNGTPLLAPVSGLVTHAGPFNSILGVAVIIKASEGDHIKTMILGHLETGSPTVRKGQQVKEGQVVGLAGNTGNAKDMPEAEQHTHLVVRMDGEPVDPVRHFAERPAALPVAQTLANFVERIDSPE